MRVTKKAEKFIASKKPLKNVISDINEAIKPLKGTRFILDYEVDIEYQGDELILKAVATTLPRDVLRRQLSETLASLACSVSDHDVHLIPMIELKSNNGKKKAS